MATQGVRTLTISPQHQNDFFAMQTFHYAVVLIASDRYWTCSCIHWRGKHFAVNMKKKSKKFKHCLVNGSDLKRIKPDTIHMIDINHNLVKMKSHCASHQYHTMVFMTPGNANIMNISNKREICEKNGRIQQKIVMTYCIQKPLFWLVPL